MCQGSYSAETIFFGSGVSCTFLETKLCAFREQSIVSLNVGMVSTSDGTYRQPRLTALTCGTVACGRLGIREHRWHCGPHPHTSLACTIRNLMILVQFFQRFCAYCLNQYINRFPDLLPNLCRLL